MARVEVQNITKTFPGGVQAVNDVSLDVVDKEFLVLVGPSGCGKSTLLRLVAGLEEITSGEIRIADRVVNDVPPKDRDIAMVFQNYALYPHMTVYKNMAFGLKLRKYKKDEIDRRVREAAQILGIEDLLDRKPRALSGGQRQRVAVGRAIVRQPQVFLFDEPLSNLDAKLRALMRAEIIRLHDRLQATMIYVTHDQVEAMTMGDRIVVMLDGKVQQIADPITLYEKPLNRFVAGFIGSPPMNFLEGTLAENSGRLEFQLESLRLPVPTSRAEALRAHAGQAVTLGIRPEHITAASSQTSPDWACLEANVDVIEPMGAEAFLHATAGPARLVARMEGHFRAPLGSAIPLTLDMARCHFFEKDSGRNLA
jgi:multiple sugar transport system ATP-binding protein